MRGLEENRHYEGYSLERFTDDIDSNEKSTIPYGPWSTENHVQVEIAPSVFTDEGLQVDALGRPLHPWVRDMSAAIGLIAGRGAYWNWGPNRTVDPIVITDSDDPHILLVKRNDNGRWAFPGGFLDLNGETIIEASQRECLEETGVTINGQPNATVYVGPVADARTTAHAWAQTDAKLWRPKQKQLVKPQIEEVSSVDWIAVDDLPSNLHGSHAIIIELALREI